MDKGLRTITTEAQRSLRKLFQGLTTDTNIILGHGLFEGGKGTPKRDVQEVESTGL